MLAKYTKIILLLLTLFLTGCGEPTKLPEFNKEGLPLEIVINFTEDLEKDAWSYEEGLTGQALYSPNDNVCEIVVSNKLSTSEQQETLGHELMHCLYGDYHK